MLPFIFKNNSTDYTARERSALKCLNNEALAFYGTISFAYSLILSESSINFCEMLENLMIGQFVDYIHENEAKVLKKVRQV